MRALGIFRLCKRILLFGAGFEFRPLFLEQLLLFLVEFGLLEQTDRYQVPLDDVTELGDDRRHEPATRFPVSTTGIEDGLQLIGEESHIATFAEHR